MSVFFGIFFNEPDYLSSELVCLIFEEKEMRKEYVTVLYIWLLYI